ncbi:putative membrane protein [Peptoniphilus sp. ING2-D1G]|nr:putative membrane protein [Peptoniphilus sp. ING2-D1G]
MAKDNTIKKTEEKKSLAKYFRGVKSEFKKVVWPTKKELINYSLIVIAAVVAASVLFIIYDKIVMFLLGTFIY